VSGDGALLRLEGVFISSARRLRSNGRMDAAREAERFASWARFGWEEPETAKRLHAWVEELRSAADRAAFLDKVLDGALSLLGAELGNVQAFDPASRSLRIVSHRGFGSRFLDHFRIVTDDGSACGRAASALAQTVIADVNEDPDFSPHREIAATAGFRAVQSTPIVDRFGRLRGMISTHFESPRDWAERDLLLMRRYAELVGEELHRVEARGTTAVALG
jgi:GAF domain-containing protein